LGGSECGGAGRATNSRAADAIENSWRRRGGSKREKKERRQIDRLAGTVAPPRGTGAQLAAITAAVRSLDVRLMILLINGSTHTLLASLNRLRKIATV